MAGHLKNAADFIQERTVRTTGVAYITPSFATLLFSSPACPQKSADFMSYIMCHVMSFSLLSMYVCTGEELHSV